MIETATCHLLSAAWHNMAVLCKQQKAKRMLSRSNGWRLWVRAPIMMLVIYALKIAT
jgi:hypothetical protein